MPAFFDDLLDGEDRFVVDRGKPAASLFVTLLLQSLKDSLVRSVDPWLEPKAGVASDWLVELAAPSLAAATNRLGR